MARRSTPGRALRTGAGQRGVTYLGLMLAVALTSGALAAGSLVWSQQQRRERETQLLWAGEQIRRALLSYAAAGVDVTGSRYPTRLEDLLDDPRSLARKRHLRRLYHDPMTHGRPWGLVRDERGGIIGVYSQSDAVPIKTGGFAALYEHFAQARSYRDWRFATAGLVPVAAAASTGAAASAASAAAPARGAASAAAPAASAAPPPDPTADNAPTPPEPAVDPVPDPEPEPDPDPGPPPGRDPD